MTKGISFSFYFVTFAMFVAIRYNDQIVERTIENNYSLSKFDSDFDDLLNSEMDMTTLDMIKKEGYPAEEHVVLTEDGYILTMHRIPGAKGASPVIVQHGLITSSFDWVVAGRQKGLAFLLADQGYDVWLANGRGNTYSRAHMNYTTSEYKFWDFSWHEMGVYDVPAQITYTTNVTGQDVIFIGYSMGTTMFYVTAIERPDVASKVKAMFSLAPIAFVDNAQSPMKMFHPFSRLLELLTHLIGTAEFLSQGPLLHFVSKYVCSTWFLQRSLCANFIFSIVGYDDRQLNYTLLPTILNHTPAGSSLKSLIHYYQSGSSRRFQYYDHGIEENLKKYNCTEPPDYDISKIQVPIGIFWSDNDYFAHPVDVQRFYNKLPKRIINYRVKNKEFNHADYMWAIEAPKYVYSKLISIMEKYR